MTTEGSSVLRLEDGWTKALPVQSRGLHFEIKMKLVCSYTLRGFIGIAFALLTCFLPNAVAAPIGILKIESNETDVHVTIDGIPKGIIASGPLLLELEPGSYSITGSKANFGKVTLTTTVAPNQVTTLFLEIKGQQGFNVRKPAREALMQGLGSLTVITDIPGAVVRLNGNLVNGAVTPFTVDDLGAGAWKVEATVNNVTIYDQFIINDKATTVARLFFVQKNKQAFETALEVENFKTNFIQLDSRLKLLISRLPELKARRLERYPDLVYDNGYYGTIRSSLKRGERKVLTISGMPVWAAQSKPWNYTVECLNDDGVHTAMRVEVPHGVIAICDRRQIDFYDADKYARFKQNKDMREKIESDIQSLENFSSSLSDSIKDARTRTGSLDELRVLLSDLTDAVNQFERDISKQ